MKGYVKIFIGIFLVVTMYIIPLLGVYPLSCWTGIVVMESPSIKTM